MAYFSHAFADGISTYPVAGAVESLSGQLGEPEILPQSPAERAQRQEQQNSHRARRHLVQVTDFIFTKSRLIIALLRTGFFLLALPQSKTRLTLTGNPIHSLATNRSVESVPFCFRRR